MTQDQILANKNVQALIHTLDLDAPDYKSLNVCDYSLENGFIAINVIEVLDRDGNHLRYADLNKVVDHLDKYNVTFKNK